MQGPEETGCIAEKEVVRLAGKAATDGEEGSPGNRTDTFHRAVPKAEASTPRKK